MVLRNYFDHLCLFIGIIRHHIQILETITLTYHNSYRQMLISTYTLCFYLKINKFWIFVMFCLNGLFIVTMDMFCRFVAGPFYQDTILKVKSLRMIQTKYGPLFQLIRRRRFSKHATIYHFKCIKRATCLSVQWCTYC